MKAMILAAGEGSRLAPLTDRQPKPILPILNRPHLTYTLSLLRRFGIEQVVINLHHHSDRIIETLGDGAEWGVSITYSPEERLLGTAGAVKRAARYFDEPFLVLYGDNLIDGDLQALIQEHERRSAACTIALHRAPDPTAAGLVETDGDGRVVRFREKPPREEVTTEWANGGVYVLDPTRVEAIPPEKMIDFGHDLFPTWITEGVAIYAQPLEGMIRDIGTPMGYLSAHWEILADAAPRLAGHWQAGLKERAPGIWCAPDAQIEAGADLCAPVVLGERCVVESGAEIGPCAVLGTASRVRQGARVKRAILWYHSVVEAAAQVEDAVVAAEARVGERAVLEGGALVGAGARVPSGTRLPAGVRFRGEG